MDRASSRAPLPVTVIVLGLVSLLADVSSEMVFPLLPAFLAQRISNAPVLLGAMEGVADLVSAAFKWWSGKWADRARSLRPMVIAGYGIAALARPLMAWVGRWWQPVLIRSIDRIGKGIRTSPRDALISYSVSEGSRGRAFGFHRGMDNAGAALGSLVAAALVGMGFAVPTVFVLSALPGGLAVAALFFVREPESRPLPTPVGRSLEPVPRRLFAYLGPVALFGIANSTDAFLLLKLNELGAAPQVLPLAWFLLQAVKALISFPAGWVADLIGSAKVVAIGWTLYAASYLGLALATSVPAALTVIGFYGLYHGFSEGAERALLSQLSPASSRGRAFGLYHALSGISSLAAGLGFGGLWVWKGSGTAFLTAGAIAGCASILLLLLLPIARGSRPAQGF